MKKKDLEPAAMEEAVDSREAIIVRTSVIGIVANLFLVAFKAFVGLLSNSIAVILDAVNNLTDAISSIVTIIGSKLAVRRPTKKHPMGFGRMEYMSALIVSVIVIYAGVTAGTSSIKAILDPIETEYSATSLIIIAVAVLVKVVLGTYVRKKGREVNSTALVASGSDALFDAILSFSVFASALIDLIFGISLEAYVGIIISLFIIKAGIEMMMETINDILGKRIDIEISRKIKRVVCDDENVYGAYDLFLNNYGPNKDYASIHVELPDVMTVEEADAVTREIQHKVYKETGVILTGIGIYSHNTKDNEAARIRNNVRKIVLDNEWAVQMHGFYVDTETKQMRFDVVFSFDIEASRGHQIVKEQVQNAYPDYNIHIAADVDLD